mgnify:CR=1 FL=1|tara:strand:+ start:190 stop:411 length:222 start_codon:yes stop_codon:yes gene_type:complete
MKEFTVYIIAMIPVEGTVIVSAETLEDAVIEAREPGEWTGEFEPLNHLESWQPRLVQDNAESVKTSAKPSDYS